MEMLLRLRCKRCNTDYPLEPGEQLTEFCETCTRILGAKLDEFTKLGLNRRIELMKDYLNRIPAGHPSHDEMWDPKKVFSK